MGAILLAVEIGCNKENDPRPGMDDRCRASGYHGYPMFSQSCRDDILRYT